MIIIQSILSNFVSIIMYMNHTYFIVYDHTISSIHPLMIESLTTLMSTSGTF